MTTEPTTDRAALRERIAEALRYWVHLTDRGAAADAVLAVLPVPSAPTGDQAVLREQVADVLADADGWTWAPGFDRHRSPAYQAYLERANRVVGLLAAYDTTQRAAAFAAAAEAVDELSMQVEQDMKRYEIGPLTALQDAADVLRRLAAGAQQPEPGAARTADGATALRDAADFFERVLEQSLDPGNDPRYCTAVRDVVMGLRRRADETQQDAPCGRPGALPGPCSAGGHCCQPQQPGAQQQPTTETQPPRYRWRVETRDGIADEWAPGTAYLNRHHAVERYETATRNAPLWRDGTPVERRIVRETTTYTVETPSARPEPMDPVHILGIKADEPAPVSPVEAAEELAARHRRDGWPDRAQGAQDVADLLRAGDREEQRRD